MMAMTTSNSIRVKPRRLERWVANSSFIAEFAWVLFQFTFQHNSSSGKAEIVGSNLEAKVAAAR
jgi:hypothetical protein